MRLQRLLQATALTTIGSTGAFLQPSARPRSLSRRCACTRTSNDVDRWCSTRPLWTPCQASGSPLATTSALGKRRDRRRTIHGSRLAHEASCTAEEEVGRIEARNEVLGIDATSSSSVDAVDHFVTPPLQVYIEDTDAYGVMYNGNYLRAYDRALHTMFVPTAADDAEDEDSTTTAAPTWASRDDSWSIVSVEELKFKSPPPFGGTYCIEGTRRRPDPEGSAVRTEFDAEAEVWDMVMRSPDGSMVYNAATGVTLAHHPSPNSSTHDRTEPAGDADASPADDWLPCPPPLSIPGGSWSSSSTTTTSSSVETFRTYRDEFEPHLDGHLPLRIALNYMERSRTNAIGGPAMLRDLQTEHGILCVVTAVRNGSLVAYGAGSTDSGGGGDPEEQRDRRCTAPRLVPGARVDVETAFRVRKRGAVIDCYHTLVWEPTTATTTAPTSPVERYRVAQGVVTIMALDAATRRPTNKLPAWLLSRFDGSARS